MLLIYGLTSICEISNDNHENELSNLLFWLALEFDSATKNWKISICLAWRSMPLTHIRQAVFITQKKNSSIILLTLKIFLTNKLWTSWKIRASSLWPKIWASFMVVDTLFAISRRCRFHRHFGQSFSAFFWLALFRASLKVVHKFYLCPLAHTLELGVFFIKTWFKCVGEIKPKVSAKSIKFVKLKTLFDTQLYIHAKGEEFLIGLSVFPTEVKIVFYKRSKSVFPK